MHTTVCGVSANSNANNSVCSDDGAVVMDNLPSEIILQILDYLPLEATFEFLRCSRLYQRLVPSWKITEYVIERALHKGIASMQKQERKQEKKQERDLHRYTKRFHKPGQESTREELLIWYGLYQPSWRMALRIKSIDQCRSAYRVLLYPVCSSISSGLRDFRLRSVEDSNRFAYEYTRDLWTEVWERNAKNDWCPKVAYWQKHVLGFKRILQTLRGKSSHHCSGHESHAWICPYRHKPSCDVLGTETSENFQQRQVLAEEL